MKQLLEFLPLVLFFGAYQLSGETLTLGNWSHTFDGIFSATAVLMACSVVVWLIGSMVDRRNDKRLMWMALAVVIFGSATLILRDQRFIQWKPTVFNWGLAVVFLTSQFFGEKNLLERLMGQQLTLPQRAWGYLNALWIANFTLVGALNIFVAYRFEEAFWVSYKLYSSVGFTLLLMVLSILLVMPYLKDQDSSNDEPESLGGAS
ncbi:MAG: inner membrane-spanning protein YciB [Halieaceae bacterium]|jgi:intracellular septation protein